MISFRHIVLVKGCGERRSCRTWHWQRCGQGPEGGGFPTSCTIKERDWKTRGTWGQKLCLLVSNGPCTSKSVESVEIYIIVVAGLLRHLLM